MDALPILVKVARVLREQRLEAVMIGNAAAALRGAPVTTLHIDFFIPRTATTLRKLKKIAASLQATAFAALYPVPGVYRLFLDADAVQIDFQTRVDGMLSFEEMRRGATSIEIEGETLLVASRSDLIASTSTAGRPNEIAVIRESAGEIRQPLAERTNFLRRKIGITGSCL